MFFVKPATLLSLSAALLPFVHVVAAEGEASSCTFEQRRAAIAAEIKTISSHSSADAAKIPLTPFATRTFLVTPSELGGGVTLPPINVGVTAETVREELVGLGTVLNASVPSDSVKYINNANGSVTVDFIQLDGIALPREHVREIHDFDLTTCQISRILGYVHGPLECPTNSKNPFLVELCNEFAKAS